MHMLFSVSVFLNLFVEIHVKKSVSWQMVTIVYKRKAVREFKTVCLKEMFTD